MIPHQYIERKTSRIMTEKLYGDSVVNRFCSGGGEKPSLLFKILTSARMTDLLGFLIYDISFAGPSGPAKFFADRLNLSECLDRPESLNTARKIFERKIRYWETRQMPNDPESIVSPADSKMLVGSFSENSRLFLKEKFFRFEELLGPDKTEWLDAFRGGDFAIFRLTPEKYHYNHSPVSGVVADIYEIPGCYGSCNPGALISVAEPFSKNRRVVTVIDTDVEGGTRAGLAAMIEIVALMIGDIVQCYSESRYEYPQDVRKGMFLKKGQPKSLYRPGSSTDLLIFQKGKAVFSPDIRANMYRTDVRSRFSEGFGRPLVETEVEVRSEIGKGVRGLRYL